MDEAKAWRAVCHKGYDYKLTNGSDEPVFNVHVTCPMDGVIPYGHDVEDKLLPGRSVRFRLINAQRFDPHLVKILWTDIEDKNHSVMLHTLTELPVVPH